MNIAARSQQPVLHIFLSTCASAYHLALQIRHLVDHTKHLLAVAITLLLLLSAAALTHAQTPRFHRDCATGMLLVNGSCLPMDSALAASGGRVFWVAQATGNDANPGSAALPWRTISKAAAVLLPGDSVIVRAGVYRESIRPARGGTDEAHRTTYAAYTGEQVIVSGADILPSSEWTQYGSTWRHTWTVSLCATSSTDPVKRREMVIGRARFFSISLKTQRNLSRKLASS